MKRVVLTRKNSLFVGERARGPDGGDSRQPDQHLPSARDRSTVVSDATVGELAQSTQQPAVELVAGSLETTAELTS